MFLGLICRPISQPISQRWFVFASLFIFTLGQTACQLIAGSSNPTPIIESVSQEPCTPREPMGRVRFDCNFSDQRYATLRDDLLFLRQMRFDIQDEAVQELQEILHLSTLSGEALFDWFQDRVSFLLSDTFAPQGKGRALASNGVSSVLQQFQNPFAIVEVPGVGEIEINAQKAGLVSLYRPFFEARDESAIVERFGRLAVLLHEARHSDGRGPSFGFLHTTCPLGHRFEGQMVCDPCRNGPYRIASLFTQVSARICEPCTVREKLSLIADAEANAEKVLVESRECDDSWEYL